MRRSHCFTGTAFKKDRFLKTAWIVFLAAFAVHLAFIVARGIAAKRLPLSNQFEFANAFAWGVALLLVVMRPRLKTDWLSVAAMPATVLVMTYAALQPMEIHDLTAQRLVRRSHRLGGHQLCLLCHCGLHRSALSADGKKRKQR